MNKINRIPFLLWLTEKRDDLTLDLKNLKVKSEELGTSEIAPVPVYVIVLLKYFPILTLAIFFLYPQSKMDFGILFCSFIAVVVVFFLARYETLLKVCLILFCFINIYFIIQNNNYASHLSTGITFFVELLMVGAVFYDVYFSKGYKNWYFLYDFKREVKLTVSQKKEKKFLFFKNKKTGFDIKKTFSLKGYFLKVGDLK